MSLIVLFFLYFWCSEISEALLPFQALQAIQHNLVTNISFALLFLKVNVFIM